MEFAMPLGAFLFFAAIIAGAIWKYMQIKKRRRLDTKTPYNRPNLPK